MHNFEYICSPCSPRKFPWIFCFLSASNPNWISLRCSVVRHSSQAVRLFLAKCEANRRAVKILLIRVGCCRCRDVARRILALRTRVFLSSYLLSFLRHRFLYLSSVSTWPVSADFTSNSLSFSGFAMKTNCDLEISFYNVLLSIVFLFLFTLSLIGNSLVIFTILSKTHRWVQWLLFAFALTYMIFQWDSPWDFLWLPNQIILFAGPVQSLISTYWI